jgi:hypothetical protein
MARKLPIKAPAQPDPDAVSNAKVLADRKRRLDAEAEAAYVPPAAPRENNATEPLEFLTEEFDKKYFGEALPTIERIVYGPDPLLDDPQFKERIERFGVLEVAEMSAKAILDKGAMSQSSPIMQAGLARGIRKFGVEAIAKAFYDRVMKIPVRTQIIEVERDDETLGDPLREAVQKYGSPGMAPKFMSESCIAQLSMRGYRVVRDERGDPVKVATLIMTEIPQRIADRRRKQYAEESIQDVRDSEASYQDNIERVVAEVGARGAGSGPLATGEVLTANATEEEGSLGQARAAGVSFEV